MDHPNFGSAVIPAMAGFFFGKRAKVQEIQQQKAQLPAVIPVAAGETGVSRYLMASPVVSGVTKYLKKKEKEPVSSVAVYMLRQDIAERNSPRATGVAKYVSKAAKDQSRSKTCVDKYLLKQELAKPKPSSLSGVARYQAEQDLVARKKSAAEMAQKYREAEAAELLAKQEAKLTVAKFTEEDILAAEASIAAEVTAAATGVGRYLQQTAKKVAKPTTGVARYIAKQIILDSQKPALSKVGRYLRNQETNQSKKPLLTGVARYLSKLPIVTEKAATSKAKPAPSGVSRYIEVQANGEGVKIALTGVAKYLDVKEKIEADKIKKLEHLSAKLVDESGVKALEGEFIPANSFYADTGVSKYLARQQGTSTAANNTVAASKATGVSQYLEKQMGVTKGTPSPSAVLTGVDRYIRGRASA